MFSTAQGRIDGPHEGRGRGARVGGVEHGTDNGNAAGARCNHGLDSLRGDTTNTHGGQSAEARTPTDQSWPDWRSGIRLRFCRESGADPQIRRSSFSGTRRLLVGIGRVADDERVSSNLASRLDRQIIDSEMNAIGTRRQGDIEPVVHDEERAVFIAGEPDLLGQIEGLPIEKRLRPQLDGGGATLQGGPDDLHDAPVGLGRIGDDTDAQTIWEMVRHSDRLSSSLTRQRP